MWCISHAVPKWGDGSGCPAFMGVLSPVLYRLFVPARHAKIHEATKIQAATWNFTNSCQITKILTRLLSVPSLNRKIVNDRCCCLISAVILTTSKLEAILKIWWNCWKLSQWGRAVGGGPLVGASTSAQAAGAQVASGYTPGDTIPWCYSSVSFSLSTFLCIAVSWAVIFTP